MRVILKRDSQGRPIVQGVQHVIVRHSPTGFEWGYGGSGPADLALNILCQCMPVSEALKHYQRFKWEVIARIPFEGGVITDEDVEEFLKGMEE